MFVVIAHLLKDRMIQNHQNLEFDMKRRKLKTFLLNIKLWHNLTIYRFLCTSCTLFAQKGKKKRIFHRLLLLRSYLETIATDAHQSCIKMCVRKLHTARNSRQWRKISNDANLARKKEKRLICAWLILLPITWTTHFRCFCPTLVAVNVIWILHSIPLSFRSIPVSFRFIPVSFRSIPVSFRFIPVSFRYHSGLFRYHSGSFRYHSGLFRYHSGSFPYHSVLFRYHPGSFRYHSGLFPVSFRFILVSFRSIPVHSGSFRLIPFHSVPFLCLVTPLFPWWNPIFLPATWTIDEIFRWWTGEHLNFKQYDEQAWNFRI